MTRLKTSLIVGCMLTVVLGVRVRTADQILIPAGSSWKFNDTGTDLGTGWRGVAYSDTAWPSGLAQLGYGDGDEATVISYGPDAANRRITYYFRRVFTVANPAAFSALAVRYVRDDGAIIYLNGVEVVRSNMPTGTVTYNTVATVSPSNENAWIESPIDSALLVAGTNVIAVEIHQQSAASSDVSFDLELRATEAALPGPAVTLNSPANHAVSNGTTVTFTATASAPDGLASASLVVAGPPLTVTFSGPTQIEDAQITADTPTASNGTGLSVNVDGASPHAHGLMRFPTLVGTGSGQVPPGAIITSASLQLNCTNAGSTMRVFRLIESWVESQATWNQRSTGVNWGSAGAEGTGSNSGVAHSANCGTTGLQVVDLTALVQEWVNGTTNHGMLFADSGSDGIDFSSSESSLSPLLTVSYRSTQQALETKPVSGTTAQVSFTATLSLAQTYFWNVRVTDTLGRQATAPSDFDVTVDTSAPNEPTSPSPAPGSTNVSTSPSVSAFVSDPNGGPLTASVALRGNVAPEFTIIVLPDTQHYSELFPAIFTSQTQWIVNNKNARNIVFVTQEGDLVQHYDNVTEWQRANTSMSILDGVVPYGMAPGNHDLPSTLYNQTFPYTRYEGKVPWYGGHYGSNNDNNYQLFSGGGTDFVIVHLTFCPSSAVVNWARSIFQQYPDRVGIMTTHGYLGLNAERSVEGCTNTQYLWDGLALQNPNLRFMLSGHEHGEARRTDNAHGQPVYQMLADYQHRASGGEGWLRIMRFVPAEDKVYVQTYSPWLNRFETDADSQFTLDFPMGGAVAATGSVTVQSNSPAVIPISGLTPATPYEWTMTVTNSSGKSRTGPVWTFTTGTGGPVNQPPTANAQSVNVQEDAGTPVTLSGSDPDGNPLTYSVVTGPAHGTLTGTPPSLTYQPAANYTGADSFTFRVNDGQANSAAATVSIAVQAVNDPPVANGDSYNVAAGGSLTVAAPGILGNDTDVDSPLTAQLVTGPANGVLTLNATGSFTYTPTAGFSGPDAFSYRASDGLSTSANATVNLSVAADTTAPTRSNGLPSGTLAAGTTQATMSLATNEAATCRYATTAGTAYGAMPNTFTTTGAVSHSTLLTGLANGGSYTYYVRCQDSVFNANTTDFTIAFTVAAPGSNLVAAYSFNEGSGSTLTDRSGRGHTGSISGATWTTSGQYGGALSFDGVNDWVTVSDSAALDLTTGMTLEAWVYPTSVSSWRTVIMKQRTGGLAYALYAASSSMRPAGWGTIAGSQIGVSGPSTLPLNTWTHLATTFDGTTLRIFVNGNEVATRTQAGSITTSSSVLRIGGNSVWGRYFRGRIDEIRIYNRALAPSEIQADMKAPITP
jgi:hypothetical protein